MSYDLAQLIGRDVSRETMDKLDHYVGLLLRENQRQNLVGGSTVGDVWNRHIADSAQLLRFAPREGASWVDIGSGAGLPGMVVAILEGGAVTLVEPRRLRAQFLAETVQALGLEQVSVVRGKADKAVGKFDVITARAVATTDRIVAMTFHLSHLRTIWALPRGRGGKSELAEVKRNWQGEFQCHESLTDPGAVIITMTGITAKGKQ